MWKEEYMQLMQWEALRSVHEFTCRVHVEETLASPPPDEHWNSHRLSNTDVLQKKQHFQ